LALPVGEIGRLILQAYCAVDHGYGALSLCGVHSCILSH
jgi:hypothetical protein